MIECRTTTRHQPSRSRWSAAMALLALLSCFETGCSRKEESIRVRVALAEPMVLAVAPVLNFTGEFNLDPVRAADLLASELTFVDGATVLPVNRVVAVLAAQGKSQIESPAHAVAVAEAVGADGIFIAGITEYDAYIPVIGIVLQLYEVRRAPDISAIDPSAVSRAAHPVSMSETHDSLTPTGQVQFVYNANHGHIVDAVRAYGTSRNEDLQMGWRQYLKVQTLFIRFCWHDALTRLLAQTRLRLDACAAAGPSENL